MQTILSKYSYEKVWRPTSLKDLERMVAEELPDAPLKETVDYIIQSCNEGKVVNFMEVSFKKDQK